MVRLPNGELPIVVRFRRQPEIKRKIIPVKDVQIVEYWRADLFPHNNDWMIFYLCVLSSVHE